LDRPRPRDSRDGQAATVENLRARLDSFWIPGETVVYIGKATRSLATRIGQYYRTPLGDRAPHAGGHWIKTLSILDDLRVTWAEAEDPSTSEDDLLRAFAELVSKEAAANLPAGPILPFANLEIAGGVRKAHGISASRTSTTTPRMRDAPVAAVARTALVGSRSRPNIDAINAAIQQLACGYDENRVTAVEAAAELERLGLLRDSPSRRGKPLRDLLRAGAIEHAYQEGGRLWFVGCATPELSDA